MSKPITEISDKMIRALRAYHRDSDGVTYESGIALGYLSKTSHGLPVTEWRKNQARAYCVRTWNNTFAASKP